MLTKILMHNLKKNYNSLQLSEKYAFISRRWLFNASSA